MFTTEILFIGFVVIYLIAFAIVAFYPYFMGRNPRPCRQVFTFPVDHRMKDLYVVVYGLDHIDCRDTMIAHYGHEWEYQYENEEQALVDKYKLRLFEEIVSTTKREAKKK